LSPELACCSTNTDVKEPNLYKYRTCYSSGKENWSIKKAFFRWLSTGLGGC